MFATANQFIFFTIISLIGFGGSLLLLRVSQNRESYISNTWCVICAIGWFICYIASMVGLVINY